MSEQKSGRVALLAGATGLVGRSCLEGLLASEVYASVEVLVRRPVGRTHAKLRERIVDFEKLDEITSEPIDDVFITLGTTIKAAGSQDAFYKVDHDYVVAVAKFGKKAGATRIAFVSSIGVGGKAANFYLRVKEETERDVKALGYTCVEIFRPGLLVGERSEKRSGEALGIAATKVVRGLMVGPLRPYRPIEARDVADAMVAAMILGEPGTRVRTFAEMRALLGGIH